MCLLIETTSKLNWDLEHARDPLALAESGAVDGSIGVCRCGISSVSSMS